MHAPHFDLGSFVAGLTFAVVGALFLLDALDVADFRFDLVLPGAVIALGVAVIAGGAANARARRR